MLTILGKKLAGNQPITPGSSACGSKSKPLRNCVAHLFFQDSSIQKLNQYRPQTAGKRVNDFRLHEQCLKHGRAGSVPDPEEQAGFEWLRMPLVRPQPAVQFPGQPAAGPQFGGNAGCPTAR